MKITKIVPVEITVNDSNPKICSFNCVLWMSGGLCLRYEQHVDGRQRCPQCIAEFGTGE